MRLIALVALLTFSLGTIVQADTLSVKTSVPDTTTDSLLVPAKQFPLAGHVYVIDPGHGGSDTGTKRVDGGQTWYEKQFTLGVALDLMTQIRDLGGTVICTVLTPSNLQYQSFGSNLVPTVGADYFNISGQPPIVSGAVGLGHRLDIGEVMLNQYPDQQVHWLSLHFDFVKVRRGHDPVSGTRLIFAPESQETTTVQVPKVVRKKITVHGQKQWQTTTVLRDSVVAIEPPLFVRDLAQAFTDAGWLRDADQRPVVASGKKGVRHLFILRGESDAKVVGKRKKDRKVYFNHVLDRVLIEYANFKSDEDWDRLQQPDGSLHNLAAITVKGLLLNAAHDQTRP